MNSNQDILDRLLQNKILLLGFSKHLANQVIAYLRETEPDIRALILRLLGAGGPKLITRLREAEVHLREIRSKAWKRGYDEVITKLVDMAERERPALNKIVGETIAKPENKSRTLALVVGSFVAGQKIPELFAAMEAADAQRAVAQLRIGYLADETATKISRRLTGKLSLISPAANNSIRTILATGVAVVANNVRSRAVRASDLFDLEVWISILDARTTDGCRKLHEHVFPIGEGPMPGYHFHCRSDRIPITSEGGSYIANTYGNWIQNQPEDFQAYAGEEFSYNDLQPLSLDEVYAS